MSKSIEQRLRKEYMDSDYASGSAGYRKFFVNRIAELESENTKLWHNLRDAMECNWLDDDAPERFDIDEYSIQKPALEESQ